MLSRACNVRIERVPPTSGDMVCFATATPPRSRHFFCGYTRLNQPHPTVDQGLVRPQRRSGSQLARWPIELHARRAHGGSGERNDRVKVSDGWHRRYQDVLERLYISSGGGWCVAVAGLGAVVPVRGPSPGHGEFPRRLGASDRCRDEQRVSAPSPATYLGTQRRSGWSTTTRRRQSQ